MGVTLAAAGAVIAGLLLGVPPALALERLLVRAGGEAGPARSAEVGSALDQPNSDRWLLPAGPLVALAGVALGAVVIPLGPGLVGRDLGIGVFYFIVVLDFVVVGLALSGWGAATADAVESCYRVVAQLVAYVVPLGLAVIGAVMMAGSLSTVRIVEAQSWLWFAALQPFGLALYLVSGLMQCYRAPFLEPFADAVGGGVVGVAGGWTALAWHIGLSGILLLVAAMGAVLFLGGWHGPAPLPGWAWMLAKTYTLAGLMIWLGRRVRLLSTAAMLALAWRVLIPAGLANVLLVGGLVLLGIAPE